MVERGGYVTSPVRLGRFWVTSGFAKQLGDHERWYVYCHGVGLSVREGAGFGGAVKAGKGKNAEGREINFN